MVFVVACNKSDGENTDVKDNTAQTDTVKDDAPKATEPAADTTKDAQDESTAVPETEKVSEYVFLCETEDGAPIEGVKLQVCNDDACMMKESDASGKITVDGEPCEYVIHVYSGPDGYELVSEKDFNTGLEFETFKILFRKLN